MSLTSERVVKLSFDEEIKSFLDDVTSACRSSNFEVDSNYCLNKHRRLVFLIKGSDQFQAIIGF